MFGLPPLLGYLRQGGDVCGAGRSARWQPLLILAVAGRRQCAARRRRAGADDPAVHGRSSCRRRRTPHEAPLALLVGPVVLGAARDRRCAASCRTGFGDMSLAPAASAIARRVESRRHLSFGIDPLELPFWLSVATWVLGGLVYWRLDCDPHAAAAARGALGWTFDSGFDRLMFGLIRFAGGVTRLLHHGRLELYLVVVFVAAGAGAASCRSGCSAGCRDAAAIAGPARSTNGA